MLGVYCKACLEVPGNRAGAISGLMGEARPHPRHVSTANVVTVTFDSMTSASVTQEAYDTLLAAPKRACGRSERSERSKLISFLQRRLGIILLEREDFERAHHREERIAGVAGRGPDLWTFPCRARGLRAQQNRRQGAGSIDGSSGIPLGRKVKEGACDRSRGPLFQEKEVSECTVTGLRV
ncbi:hypothetical protein NDU88_006234 [Pleurodeles waltl]|uniref:Uncharacterized protein n=1 Tax=Pleurodeles waltl TaxID=8319 RepID=A0AAV7N0P4_PLEWA|nr:hypothetical protein NDU88_006234 [Pleurodeles waltl]